MSISLSCSAVLLSSVSLLVLLLLFMLVIMLLLVIVLYDIGVVVGVVADTIFVVCCF